MFRLDKVQIHSSVSHSAQQQSWQRGKADGTFKYLLQE